MLNRTFGCVRVVWNRTLAARQALYAAEGKSTSYPQANRNLTMMKRDPELAWLNEVSAVALQYTLRLRRRRQTARGNPAAVASETGNSRREPGIPDFSYGK